MKTLLIFDSRLERLSYAQQQQREARDECPRMSLLEHALNADVLDHRYLQSLPRIRRFFHRFVPLPLVRVWEAFRKRHQYDVVVSWDDRFALIYSLLLKLTRSHAHHVAILCWMASPKKAFILKMVQSHMDRIVLWSQNHKALLTELFGIAPSRITVIPYFVDQQFWRPIDRQSDSICSAGDSKRDYATLIEAMREMPLTCRIAARVRPSPSQDKGDWSITGNNLARATALPENVAVATASHAELREIYARSHFVVVPLFPSFRDHGITTIAEAMAMGKAVICSRIYGLVDFVNDGENGIFVPPDDSRALRDAILYLLDHSDVAARMGAEGRWRAEKIFALDGFADNIRCIVEDVVKGTCTPILAAEEAIRVFKNTSGRGFSSPSPVFSSRRDRAVDLGKCVRPEHGSSSDMVTTSQPVSAAGGD